MKAYIWNSNFLTDYSSGIGVVAADSEEEARTIGKSHFISRGMDDRASEFDPAPDEVIDLDAPKVIAIEWGGA